MAVKSGTQYPDLRHKFIRGLIEREQQQRRQHYLKQASECTSRAIVSLQLCLHPVRSVKQAAQLEGIGVEISRQLKGVAVTALIDTAAPRRGRFCSSAGALLVALLQAESTGEEESVGFDALRVLAQPMCEERFIVDNERPGAATDRKTVLCSAWWRISLLVARGLVKKRTKNKQPVYSLLDPGRQLAHQLAADQGCDICAKVVAMVPPPLPTLAAAAAREDALYSNDTGEDGVVLLVDRREWGGEHGNLHMLMQMLATAGVCYQSRHLVSGDYQWLWRRHGVTRTLPVLAERKRADDLAKSLRDGRFEGQRARMKAWCEELSGRGVRPQTLYIVEGDPQAYVIQCRDGCGGVGGCGQPTLLDVQIALTDLNDDPELSLVRTAGIEATVDLLAHTTADLQHRCFQGDFNILLNEGVGAGADLVANVTVKAVVTKLTAATPVTPIPGPRFPFSQNTTSAGNSQMKFSGNLAKLDPDNVGSVNRENAVLKRAWPGVDTAVVKHPAVGDGAGLEFDPFTLQTAIPLNMYHSDKSAVEAVDAKQEVESPRKQDLQHGQVPCWRASYKGKCNQGGHSKVSEITFKGKVETQDTSDYPQLGGMTVLEETPKSRFSLLKGISLLKERNSSNCVSGPSLKGQIRIEDPVPDPFSWSFLADSEKKNIDLKSSAEDAKCNKVLSDHRIKNNYVIDPKPTMNIIASTSRVKTIPKIEPSLDKWDTIDSAPVTTSNSHINSARSNSRRKKRHRVCLPEMDDVETQIPQEPHSIRDTKCIDLSDSLPNLYSDEEELPTFSTLTPPSSSHRLPSPDRLPCTATCTTQVLSILPGTTLVAIETALVAVGGDPEAAVSWLLDHPHD